ncbi:hypothetical protein DFH05DRAFT_1073978 [Lentinula detonsa]|uniref:Uncharacterized protein n=1 Tax=Lentinula detonsa TaxID=2804962 RepID=A0A9W8TXN9_9AGAR|nr:hypothetical protein DFH05DRAFT_1073978 [Lentinula detonsa]
MNSAYIGQFQSDPFIQYGSTKSGRCQQPNFVTPSHQYNPSNDEHVFNSKNPKNQNHAVILDSSEYPKALTRCPQKRTVAVDALTQVVLAQPPSHFPRWHPRAQIHASMHPSRNTSQSEYSSYPLTELENVQISSQTLPSHQTSTTALAANIGNTRSGVIVAAPVPKKMVASSETVLNALNSVRSQSVAQDLSGLQHQPRQVNGTHIFCPVPTHQFLNLNQSKNNRLSAPSSKSQHDAKENPGHPFCVQDVHSSRSSSDIQEHRTQSNFDEIVIADTDLNSAVERRDPVLSSSTSKNGKFNSEPLRSITPTTMIALTEPILMSWCFDDVAVQRLAKAAGYE